MRVSRSPALDVLLAACLGATLACCSSPRPPTDVGVADADASDVPTDVCPCTQLPGVDPALTRCTDRGCSLVCRPGRANCSANPNDGCESDITTAAHCRNCTTTCVGATPVCAPTGCTGTCEAPTPTRCGTSCVDLATDPNHCGACALACPTPPNAIASCAGGVCGFACTDGFRRCGASCVAEDANHCGPSCAVCLAPAGSTPICTPTGCSFTCPTGQHACDGECVDDTSTATCGATCDPCVAPANAVASCDGHACGFACNVGFHACHGACVSDRSVAACGATCAICPSVPGASETCASGTCGFTCAPGRADCNGSAADGCEADLTTAQHCGACGFACPTLCVVTASGSHCAATCPPGRTLCGTACVDLTSNVVHCGDCDSPCDTPPGATPTCIAGECGFSCTPGLADCDGDPTNGCETDVSQDDANCGACGVACARGEQCSVGSCVCRGGVRLATDVQPIFTAHCTSDTCHGGTELADMLSLEAGVSRAALVGVPSVGCPPAVRAVAGAPERSFLLDKLVGPDRCGGERMPLHLPALTPAQVDLVARWICEGAPNN